MSKLGHQAGLLSMADFFRFFIKTLIGIALARLLTPQDLGSFRQLFLIYTTLSGILMLGFPQSLLYFLPKAKSDIEIKRIITRTLNVISLLAVVCAGAIFLFRGQIAISFNNPDLSNLLLIYSIYPIFIFITQLYSSLMLGMKETMKAAAFTIFAIFADFILILGTAIFTRDITYIVWAVIASAFIQWLYANLSMRHFTCRWSVENFNGFKEQLAYTIPLGLSLLVGVLGVQLDKLMISSYFTPAEFAVFSLGAMELPLIGILINSVNAILLPNLSSTDNVLMGKMYSASVRKNAILVFPLAVVFYLFANEFIIFVYGKTYLAAAEYFRIYLLILPLRIATYGIVFQALGKTRLVMIDAILMLCANAVLNLVLISTIGMKGAAYATVIVTWLIVMVYLWQMKYSLKLRINDFFPWLRILRTVIAALLPIILVLPVAKLIPNSIVRMIAGGLLYVILYFATALVFRAILPYDLSFALDFAKSLIRKQK